MAIALSSPILIHTPSMSFNCDTMFWSLRTGIHGWVSFQSDVGIIEPASHNRMDYLPQQNSSPTAGTANIRTSLSQMKVLTTHDHKPKLHPTQKPIRYAVTKFECDERLMTWYLMGSWGSTALACEQLGRRCVWNHKMLNMYRLGNQATGETDWSETKIGNELRGTPHDDR